MMMTEINSCCCFSLRQGTVIIGVTKSIFAFMLLILSAAYAQNPHELIEMGDPSIVPDVQSLKIVLIIIAVFSAIQFAVSLMLVFAGASNRPGLLTPWLIHNSICLAVYLVGTFIAIINHAAENRTTFVLGHISTSFLVIMVGFYESLVVYNFKKQLRRFNF